MRILLFFISFLLVAVSADASIYYRVKRGDTLGKIARRFHVTVTEIKKVNKLKGNIIYAGQKLRIPSRFQGKSHHKYVIYRVKKGDSLKKIASKFGTTVKEIKRLNNLKRDIIYPGQRLKVPTGRREALVVGSSRDFARKNTKRKIFVPGGLTKVPVYKYYRVRRGDSVVKIAKRFRVSPRSIIRVNRLRKPYILRPGQRLKILVGYRDVLKLNRPLQFRFPLDGKVDPTIREEGYPGIFIVGKLGDPVKAAETGIVKFAGRDSKLLKAFGNMVIIQHPQGYRTVYGNLDRIFVKPNQLVKRGDIIGTAGISGIWNRSGLYFDVSRVYKGKTYHIQPLEILK